MINTFFKTDFVSKRQDLVKTIDTNSIFYPYSPKFEFNFKVKQSLTSLDGSKTMTATDPSQLKWTQTGLNYFTKQGNHVDTGVKDSDDATYMGVFKLLERGDSVAFVFGNLQTSQDSNRVNWSIFVTSAISNQLGLTYRDPSNNISYVNTTAGLDFKPDLPFFVAVSMSGSNQSMIVYVYQNGSESSNTFGIKPSSEYGNIAIGNSSYDYNYDGGNGASIIASEFATYDKSLTLTEMKQACAFARLRHKDLN